MRLDELKEKIYIGTVEDNNDPDKLGRVRVRVINVFEEIDKETIPWAKPWKDLGGNTAIIPDIGKVVSVVFADGDIYRPEYIYAEHYNINLENKLKSLDGDDYNQFRAMMFDHSTQVYRTPSEGLKIDHEYTNVNLTADGDIHLNIRDNASTIRLGSSDANQAAVLGTAFMNWMDTLVSELLGEGGGPFLGNMAAPVVTAPGLINVLTQYKALRDNKFLSDHVWISENNNIKGQSRGYINQKGDAWNSTNGSNNLTSSSDPAYSPTDRDDINNSMGEYKDAEITDPKNLDPAKTPWIPIANREVGQKELSGGGHNQRIVEYLRTTGNFGTDETPWCSAFINWVMRKASIKGTNSAAAVSWAKWGQRIKGPAYGSIAVISYGGGKGHVGIVVGTNKNGSLILLGGNQGDMVCLSPTSKAKIIAYVYPSDYTPQYLLPLLNITTTSLSYKSSR